MIKCGGTLKMTMRNFNGVYLQHPEAQAFLRTLGYNVEDHLDGSVTMSKTGGAMICGDIMASLKQQYPHITRPFVPQETAQPVELPITRTEPTAFAQYVHEADGEFAKVHAEQLRKQPYGPYADKYRFKP